ncbi:MAG: hypothetical protein A2X94_04295 [Bdellovibrionales bacterium GWB1_55_8]|nr:MAG: hypothetical protein A2X94_04295 [Bdellovibrionales bacterium GWB1_55_8]
MWKLPILESRPSFSGAADTDLVGVFQESAGKVKKAIPIKGVYAPLVERFRKSEVFQGAHGSVQFVRFGGKAPAESCLLVGLGAPAEFSEEKARTAGGNAWGKLKAEKARLAVVHVDTLFGVKGLKTELSHLAVARAFAEGLILGAYEYNKHKSSLLAAKGSKGSEDTHVRVVFVTAEKGLRQQLERELDHVRASAEAIRITRDWSNEPSNIGIPEYFANEARKYARQYGLKCKVLTEREAAAEKMGLFLGVGQGAEREGRIVVLEYVPTRGSKKNLKTVALVGKGITFDSGGISIKPALRMEDMKHDMTGAATVMGAMVLSALWQVPNRVVGIMAFTENMPDGTAIQPGNVLKSRAGKTVEVINTDAEGRLILADVLDYAHDFRPDAVIDVATLTGAVGIALGKQCCAILGNDDLLADAVKRAGESCGERIWQLPLWDEYFDDMKSDTADMKNVGNDGQGGAIRGAIFLKQFIKKGTAWAHMDIASMSNGVTHLSYIPKKGATGLYVRTLARFAADF